MRFAARSLILVLALATGTDALHAQQVRGRIVTRVDGAPIGGVVLEVRDSVSVRVATSLTRADGAFRLSLPAPGVYRVITRRIGYRSVTLGPFRIDADTTLELAIEPVPQPLPPVTAAEFTTCRGADGATEDATLLLWESARTALMASSVASREGMYEFDVARWRREYGTEPTVLLDVTVDFLRLRDARPWISLPAEEIERAGYVRLAHDRSLTYVAPDLELLTSPEFASVHCFVVREDAGEPAVVGLEFRPSSGRRMSDVRGTLWLTRATQELRAIDFAYTDIGYQGPDSLAGGRLAFARLTDGAFVPTDWMVRAPLPPDAFIDALLRRARQAPPSEPIPLGRRDPPWRSHRIIVTGGTVLGLRGVAEPTPLWQRESGEVHSTVRWRRGARTAAAGVRVTLVGLDATAYTDERGEARFRDVPPGEYIVATSTDEQDFLHLPRDERVARVRSGEVTAVALTALPPQAAVNAVCEHNREDAVVAGLVTQGGRGVTSVRVRLERMSRDDAGEMQATVLRTGWSGGGGLFHLCRVPRGASYRLVAVFPDGSIVTRDVSVPSAAAAGESMIVRVDVEGQRP